MSLMDWSNSLDVGVDDMNNQHKVLLNYMNDLYTGFQKEAPFSDCLKVLDKLKDSTIAHFAEEEEYMASIGFEGLASHKVIHKALLEKFSANYEKIISEQKLNREFFDFLKFWLSAHIQGIDVKYGAWAKSRAS